MPYLRQALSAGLLICTLTAFAGQKEYDDCILKHLKNAKQDVAMAVIKQACQENYLSPGFLSDEQRIYNHCLLEHLPGVESFQAVIEIRSACERKYK